MIRSIPKISVLVICYKQENVIRRALDSLIKQRDYLYEICINDDKSPDGTWEIILEYQSKYPDLIKPIQNNPNLGIFQNIEATWKRPNGDLIYQLSGDDECVDGFFRHVVDYIIDNNIDYRNNAICIYGDYQQINVDGSNIVYKNDSIIDTNAVKAKLRQLISNRATCFSRKTLEKFINVAQGKSFVVELTQDVELQIFSEKNYYIPYLGNIYYAGIGVSKHLTVKELDEHLKVYDHFLSFCKLHSICIDNYDRNYIEYMKCYRRGKVFTSIIYFLKSIDFSLGWKGLQLNRIIFVIRKRILNH